MVGRKKSGVRGRDRRGCWREQWRKILFLKCEAKHPHCPTRAFFLPRRKMIFSGQLYSGVIVQSSANGLCQAVVTLQSYWQERWQVGEDYKGTLRDIFWWADYSEISQELKYITLLWNSQPCQRTGQLTWAFSPSQRCWPVRSEPDAGIGQGFSAATNCSDSKSWGVDRRTQKAEPEMI